MQFDRSTLISLCFLAGAVPAYGAGSVEVSFVAAAGYTDAGKDPADARVNEATLAHFLQGLGERHLAPDQVLKIDVLDIDLAGTVRPSRRANGDLRIARGGADVPRITMRYSLVVGGKVVESGEETVADLNYLRSSPDYGIADPLRHEKRMLYGWFKARFIDHKPPAG